MLPTGFRSALACDRSASNWSNFCIPAFVKAQIHQYYFHLFSVTLLYPQSDLPLVRGFWAQASESLAPPAGLNCPSHPLCFPWSTGRNLHTCSGMRCQSLDEQSQTTLLLLQTPEPESKLCHRTVKKNKDTGTKWSNINYKKDGEGDVSKSEL